MSLLFCKTAFAADVTTIEQKAFLQGAVRCYQKAMPHYFSFSLNNDKTMRNFLTGERYSFIDNLVTNSEKDFIALPSGMTDMSRNYISCTNLFSGDDFGGGGKGTFPGLLKYFAKDEECDNSRLNCEVSSINGRLSDIGYEGSKITEMTCENFYYRNPNHHWNENEYYATNSACINNYDGTVEVISPFGHTDIEKWQDNKTNEKGVRINFGGHDKVVVYNGNTEEFFTKLGKEISDNISEWKINGSNYTLQRNLTVPFTIYKNYQYSTNNNGVETATQKMSSFFSSGRFNTLNDLKFTKEERLLYYTTALTNWFFKDKDILEYYKCNLSDSDLDGLYKNYKEIKVDPSTNERVSGCYINTAEEARTNSDYMHGINVGEKTFNAIGTDTISFNTTLKRINKLVESIEKEEESFNILDNETEKDCYDAGIEGMSWILCPVVNNTTSAVDGIEKTLQDWLEIDTDNIFKDEIYTAWEVFRNIANVILTIVFLVVIFSQITGVGIDNYGIKKILPKLIIAAILINLSYIICQIAVDVSNILGVGLDRMLKFVGENIRGGQGTAVETTATIVAALLGSLGIAGASAATAITIAGVFTGGGAMLIISLVLVLLVALISVLLFFVMLGARMIIVIMFTVISPIAFALYILPNTKSIFNKWWKVFQAALVVFPICGALYGISFIIKAIIFSGDEVNFILALISVCAPFLPFLLLPSLLKNALAGLGALGGTISTLGNGLKKGISRGNDAIRGTDKFKEQQQMNDRIRQKRRVNAGINRLERKKERSGLSDNENLRLSRFYQTRDTLNKEDATASSILFREKFKDKTDDEMADIFNKEFDKNDANGKELDGLVTYMSQRLGGAMTAKIVGDKLSSLKSEDDINSRTNSIQTLQRKLARDSSFNEAMNKDAAAKKMISNGAKTKTKVPSTDENGNQIMVDGYRVATIDNFDPNEIIKGNTRKWSEQSSGALIRAIRNGNLSEKTLREMLSSTDLTTQSNLSGEKGDVVRAGLQYFENKKIDPNDTEEMKKFLSGNKEARKNLAKTYANAQAVKTANQESQKASYQQQVLDSLNAQQKAQQETNDLIINHIKEQNKDNKDKIAPPGDNEGPNP